MQKVASASRIVILGLFFVSGCKSDGPGAVERNCAEVVYAHTRAGGMVGYLVQDPALIAQIRTALQSDCKAGTPRAIIAGAPSEFLIFYARGRREYTGYEIIGGAVLRKYDGDTDHPATATVPVIRGIKEGRGVRCLSRAEILETPGLAWVLELMESH